MSRLNVGTLNQTLDGVNVHRIAAPTNLSNVASTLESTSFAGLRTGGNCVVTVALLSILNTIVGERSTE